MQVSNMGTACLFVQVLNVLCNDMYLEIFFQISQTTMSGIRLGVQQFAPAMIVEVKYQLRIFHEPFGRSHVLNPIIFP